MGAKIILLALLVLFVFLLLSLLVTRPANGKHLSGARGYVGKSVPTGELLPAVNYEKNRMFTEREKECYRRLRSIAEEFGFVVFAKVPLCFLVSPRPHIRNYDSTLGRLGFTYIDFVLCDSYLKTTMAITLELSDADIVKGSSQLDNILHYCGVDVLHVTDIDSATRDWIASHSE